MSLKPIITSGGLLDMNFDLEPETAAKKDENLAAKLPNLSCDLKAGIVISIIGSAINTIILLQTMKCFE